MSMKRAIIAGISLFALIAPRVQCGDSQQDRIARVENGLAANIQVGSRPPMNLLERMKTLKVPGLGLAVVKDFQVDWSKSYGVRDARSGAPVTDETLFQVASITKCMGAIVALKLAEEGKLDLDMDVNTYLKSWKVPENEFTRVEKVTVRRILSHTAGLTVHGFRGYAEGEAVPTILQVLDGLPPANSAAIRVERVPGTAFSYSGGGYTILQLLIEEVTGRHLPELVAEYIFKPAGMTHSTFCPPCKDSASSLTSMGHSVDRAGNLTTFKGYAFLPGGSTCCELYTTASDLARFIIAVQKALRGDPGSIVSRETARAIITPVKDAPAGLGFFIEKQGNAVYFNHSGGNIGFSAFFIGSAEGGSGYALTINSDSAGSLRSELTFAVAGTYGWEYLKPTIFTDTTSLIEDIKRRKLEVPTNPDLSEGGLNQLGYRLLRAGYADTAIAVFRLNLEFNPKSANCSDSLAEAYAGAGDKADALKYYRQALDLFDRFPDVNKGYEAQRKAAADRIRQLEGK